MLTIKEIVKFFREDFKPENFESKKLIVSVFDRSVSKESLEFLADFLEKFEFADSFLTLVHFQASKGFAADWKCAVHFNLDKVAVSLAIYYYSDSLETIFFSEDKVDYRTLAETMVDLLTYRIVEYYTFPSVMEFLEEEQRLSGAPEDISHFIKIAPGKLNITKTYRVVKEKMDFPEKEKYVDFLEKVLYNIYEIKVYPFLVKTQQNDFTRSVVCALSPKSGISPLIEVKIARSAAKTKKEDSNVQNM